MSIRAICLLGVLGFWLMENSHQAWALPDKKVDISSHSKNSAKQKDSKSSKDAKSRDKRPKTAQDDGPPPPPADNEIPPPPPKLELPRQRSKKYRQKRRDKWYRYERYNNHERSDQYRDWSERYGDKLYRRKRRYKKRRARRRRRDHYRSWRRYRRLRSDQSWKRLRFWWSTETGMYLFSFDSKIPGAEQLKFMGLLAGGRLGLGWRSLILTVGAYVAFSLAEDADGFANTGGSMTRLSGTMGWAVSKYIVLDIGMSMEYLSLAHKGATTDSLLFPFHTGVTFRFPVGRSSMGIRALTSFAFDEKTDGFYFSFTANLVFQTL